MGALFTHDKICQHLTNIKNATSAQHRETLIQVASYELQHDVLRNAQPYNDLIRVIQQAPCDDVWPTLIDCAITTHRNEKGFLTTWLHPVHVNIMHPTPSILPLGYTQVAMTLQYRKCFTHTAGIFPARHLFSEKALSSGDLRELIQLPHRIKKLALSTSFTHVAGHRQQLVPLFVAESARIVMPGWHWFFLPIAVQHPPGHGTDDNIHCHSLASIVRDYLSSSLTQFGHRTYVDEFCPLNPLMKFSTALSYVRRAIHGTLHHAAVC